MKTLKLKNEEQDKEFVFVFSKLRNKDSAKFLIFLGKMAGGSMGRAIAGMNAKGSKELTTEDISESFNTFFDKIDEEGVIEKVNLLLSCVTHEGNSLDIDYFAFDGRLDLVFRVAKESFNHNFMFFFRGVINRSERLKKTVELVSKSLKESKS